MNQEVTQPPRGPAPPLVGPRFQTILERGTLGLEERENVRRSNWNLRGKRFKRNWNVLGKDAEK